MATEMTTTTTVDSAVRGSLVWRCIGPHRGGRVVAVTGHAADPMTYWFGACAGGVWKTTDGGTNWENCSDGYLNVSAVGAIQVAPSDPNVLYIGTGETAVRGNVSHGDGVYKSTDGGASWRNVGLAETRHIGRIRIHPTDPNTVWVAALGHPFGPNEERGIYKTTDGGATWRKVLYRSADAGAIDLSIDPHNPRILYASLWEMRRNFWSLTSGGEGSGLFKSTDGGETWAEITRNPGLPTGIIGKIGVAVSPAQSGRVWALVESEDGAVFRSDDGGATWQRQSEQGPLRWRAWYYMHIFADPQNADTVYILNGGAFKSTDGGKNFVSFPTPHGDNHDLWIDPTNPKRMIEGNDGGATVTYNGGLSWSTLYNQPTAQFYHVITDKQTPYRLFGSQQDNTALSLPSFSPHGAITELEQWEPGGGESGYIAVHPKNPQVIFGGAIGSGFGNGRLIRYDHATGQKRNITVWPDVAGMGNGAKELKYRFQWTFPIMFSPHDTDALYVTSNVVHRSRDEGQSWEVVSPDLTRNDTTKMEPSGGPITRDNTGAEVYGTIFAFVESAHEAGVFWAGSDDGLIHLSRDGAKTWQNVTPEDLPEWTLVSMIEPSPHDAGTVYIAATRYKLDQYRPMLFKTNDYGQTWTIINSGLPADAITRVVREDPARRGLLYCGTETGVFVSFDDGGRWQPLAGNLPNVPVHDLLIEGSDLIAATHGRSFWILDDLSPVRELAAGIGDGTAAHLFTPRDTLRLKAYKGFGADPGPAMSYRMAGTLVITYRKHTAPDGTVTEQYINVGENPPDGVIVSYYLAEKPAKPVLLTFKDANGAVIRTFSSKAEKPTPTGDTAAATGGEGDEGQDVPENQGPFIPAAAGLNRFVWNLRYPDAIKVEGDSATSEALAGPLAVPGTYTATLTTGDTAQMATFAVLPDPRLAATQADLEAQRDFLLAIRDKLSETQTGILTLRTIRAQAAAWEKRLTDNGHSDLRDAAKSLREKAQGVEDMLIQAKADDPRQFPIALNAKLAFLASFVGQADGAPPQQTREVFADLDKRITAQLRLLDDITEADLPAFNRKVREADTPAITMDAVRPKA